MAPFPGTGQGVQERKMPVHKARNKATIPGMKANICYLSGPMASAVADEITILAGGGRADPHTAE
jgi:hypothetical protein